MKIEPTQRGFHRAEFEDANGEQCSVQESSAVCDEGMLWLGVNEVRPQVCVQNEGWKEIPLPEGAMTAGRMHLTQSQVRELLPLLLEFAETGCLGRISTGGPGE